MSMIKRAKGTIEETVDKDTKIDKSQPNLTWSNEILIKDVLEVPVNTPNNIDVDLDEDEDDIIAIKC